MAEVTKTEIFNCKPELFYSIVTDYQHYPDFLNEVKAIRIVKSEKNKKLVEYTVSMIKTFKYQLWMTETPESKISWSLAGGDIFKTSEGSWVIEPEGKTKTKATYSVQVTFGLLVPSAISKTLVSVNLPTMMESYHKRITLLKSKS